MSEPRDTFRLKLILRVDFPAERLGHGKIELMQRIADTGSISIGGPGCWSMR